MRKIILDLCGGTGSWSAPYKQAGYDVRLVTLPDNDVMEKHLKRYIDKKEVVHHIDGDCSNNRLSNLMLFPNHSAHMSFHHKK